MKPHPFGKYTLLEKLAVGGMAEIYKAKTFGAEGFEKLLAIKRILPHAAEDKEFINMLIDEAKLSVLLSHANIVQVYDLGKVGNDYFISMEYIDGINLRDLLYTLREKNQRMPTDLAVYTAAEVAKGLDYAHRKSDSEGRPLGIVHRDISPQNILISYEGEVKIVDFGIAKAAMNISHTMAGILKGKIAYMSPEQAMGKQVDGRTDIFSLGIVLYEMLTGKKLYTGDSQFEVLKKIRTLRIDAAHLPDSIPSNLKPILASALSYRPDGRHKVAADFHQALTKFLYATFTDFSPRKLANFIREVFSETLREKTKGKREEVEPEAKTGSLKILTGDQENIVHREITPPRTQTGLPLSPEITAKAPATAGGPGAQRRLWTRRLGYGLGALAGLGAIALAAGIIFLRAPEKGAPIELPAGTGTLHVISEPPEARIFLNGEPLELKTPAILDEIPLGEKQAVALALKGHVRQEKTVTLENIRPQTIHFLLGKEAGTLNLVSTPPGAAILLDGAATGKSTPATLENLALNREFKIALVKPDYEDFSRTVKLGDTQPQQIAVNLRPIETPAPPPVIGTKPPEPPPPPVAIEGEIRVSTSPEGATVYLNGKRTGKTTPATLPGLGKGTYRLRLTKEGYEEAYRKVTVAESRTYSIHGRLKEKTKAAVIPPERAPQPPPSPPPPPATTAGSGTLRISSSPSGAEIFVNGDYKGTTPQTLNVSAGNLTVLVTKGKDRMPCKQSVTLRTGQSANVSCELGNIHGEVDVVSDPPRAVVYLDGESVGGKTPLTIKRIKRDRDHTLKVLLNGYKTWVGTFHLRDTTSRSFNVQLQKE